MDRAPHRDRGSPPSAVDRPPIQRLIVGLSVLVALFALAPWRRPDSSPPVEVPSRLLVVDINQATAEELCLLPGVGPVAASDIVDERNAAGRFTSLEEVARRVRGIGPKTIEACRPYVAPIHPPPTP